jgi:hypothetical protein
MRTVIYLEGLDASTTPAMLEAYAEEWGGELSESVVLEDGTARLVFVDDCANARFLSTAHYVNDIPVRAVRVEEPSPAPATGPREIDLDRLFWLFCDALLRHSSVEDLQTDPLYMAMHEAIRVHHDRRPTALSLSYASVWGPVSMAELPLKYPPGVSYAPGEDRLYFSDIDALFYGLQTWYRSARELLPAHPWLLARARDFDRVLQKIHTTIYTDDVSDLLSATRLG